MILPIKRFAFSVSLIMILLSSSCIKNSTAIKTSMVTAESTKLPTVIPESTLTLAPLPIEAKPTPIQLPPIKTQCVDSSKNSQELNLRGVVALNKAAKPDSPNYGFYLLNLKNGNTIKDVNEGLWTQVSPDRKFLAYENLGEDADFLRLLNSNGEMTNEVKLSFDGKIVSYFNWQNSEQLRILHESIGNKLSAKLLNPFTQKYMTLRTDWKEVYRPSNPFEDKLVQWKFDQHAISATYVYGANILYDQSLTRVLYPKGNGVVSLVDVENETELANAQFQNWGELPSWSPDGQYLSILNHEGNTDEFYLVSRDGREFQKITNFSEVMGLASVLESAWSPDNKKIAFWLNTGESEEVDGAQSELAILDIVSKQVTRLCIQGISNYAYKHQWTMNHPEPIWSPDGRYIMFTQWDDPAAPKKYNVLVVDTETGAVEKISENTAPIGWMVNGQ
jgi:hypothetical protein